jgi:PAS domain S-box-containing protein
MFAIRRWSIKTKLALLSVVSVGVALVLFCIGVFVNEIRTIRSFKQETLQSQAAMLAFNCTGVLSFPDSSAANRLLLSLQSQPTVEFACLYDSNGKVLAKYPHESTIKPPQRVPDYTGSQFTESGDVEIVHRVMDRGEFLGTLYLRASASDLRQQILAYAKTVAGMSLLALGVSLLLASRLQRSISAPIQNLAQTATQITSLGDYSIRVHQQTEDELGVLCTEFNSMLDRVEKSDRALKESQERLEDRVAERTAELRDSESRLKTIIETIPAGILLIDAESHTVVDANPVACRMVGASKETIVGHVCHRFVCPAECGMCPVSDLGKTVDNSERLLLRAAGDSLPVLKTVVPLTIEGRRLFLEVFVDLSEQKRAESEIVRAKEAAEAANVAKSQFLANMSHEIRTPLNAVIGFAEILRRTGNQSDEATRQDYLETIYTSGQHLLSLINDILDLSKIEADRLEIELVRCSPHQLISDIISVLRVRALEKRLSLEYEWQSGVPETIQTDPARLRQLLMNLVSNAIKFTKKGSVRIAAKIVAGERESQLVVRVSDTGVGISPEKFASIFDPFVQADSSVTRQFGGTGLGLTICRRIAQALGGEVSVASEVGKGSTFTATINAGSLDGITILDAPAADGMGSDRQAQFSPLPSLSGKQILLVEDGDSNRKLISLLLREAGAEVVAAENGRAGSDLALASSFDLILMDMQMPVMDGYAATTLLRQQGVTVPILALTAHAMTGDEEKCRSAGCSGYIVKPIDADLLIRTIAESLGIAGDSSERSPLSSAAATPGLSQSSLAGRDQGKLGSSSPKSGNVPLYSTLPTDNSAYREIVEEFIPRLREQLAAMQRSLEKRDFEELGRLAHWLKGAAGTVGFPAFTQPARQLMVLVKQQQYEDIERVVAEIEELGQRVSVQQEGAVEVRH